MFDNIWMDAMLHARIVCRQCYFITVFDTGGLEWENNQRCEEF